MGSITWNGNEYLLLSASDQRKKKAYRHVVLISDDGGDTWSEWIELFKEGSGGASNIAVIGDGTIIAGTGNKSVQGRVFVLRAD